MSPRPNEITTDRIARAMMKTCPAPGKPANEREQACHDLADIFGCRRMVKAISWLAFVAIMAAGLIYFGISGASASAAEAGRKADATAAQVQQVGAEMKIRLDQQKETLDRILNHLKQP